MSINTQTFFGWLVAFIVVFFKNELVIYARWRLSTQHVRTADIDFLKKQMIRSKQKLAKSEEDLETFGL